MLNVGKNVFVSMRSICFSLQFISTNLDFFIYVLTEEPICKRKGTTSTIIKLRQMNARAKPTQGKKVQTYTIQFK